ncbi:MAG: glycosyltransferase family 2 protein [candidate division NC10 bacterium]|nr:glycosyltransferase family 2 protein [candidate division NC10 bacterium]
MKKLIIQIPCYNEEASLGITLSALPRQVPGIDSVEWLVVNDGSTDRTVEVAREHGVDHFIHFARRQGLAKAFMAGLEASLRAGADVIVNTDADNQYCAGDIPKLIEPILAKKAEIVIGQRPIKEMQHFSRTKKFLQRLGSWVVRIVSGTDIADAPSGFRAISREAAIRLNVFNDYTYTLEMIIQAGLKGIAITSVPVRVNPTTRPSRLVKSIPSYVQRSLFTILRIFMAYQPLRFFTILGSIPFAAGFLLALRWLVLFLSGTPRTHLPSLILASILVVVGFQIWIFGLVADLMSVNRKLLEEIQLKVRQAELGIRGGSQSS